MWRGQVRLGGAEEVYWGGMERGKVSSVFQRGANTSLDTKPPKHRAHNRADMR